MSDYAKLDADILAAVAAGNNRFNRILSSIPAPSDRRDDDRKVDRRLQALRRKGQLTYSTKGGWTIPKDKE